jgi:hypothetical protein
MSTKPNLKLIKPKFKHRARYGRARAWGADAAGRRKPPPGRARGCGAHAVEGVARRQGGRAQGAQERGADAAEGACRDPRGACREKRRGRGGRGKRIGGSPWDPKFGDNRHRVT